MTHIHGGDVYPVGSETGANSAYGAGSVYIVNEQEMTLKGCLQTEIIYPDDARILFAEGGPGGHVLVLRCLHPDRDQAGKILRLTTLRLSDFYVSFLGKHWGVDEVHLITEARGEHSFGKGYSEGYRIKSGQFTNEINRHFQNTTFGDLAQ